MRSRARSNRWRSGLPPISARGARGGLDRRQDRAGPRPGAARHRQRRVAARREQRRAGLQGERRGQQLVVVEATVAGGEHDGGPARGFAVERLAGRRRRRGSWKAAAPITKAPAPSPARSAARRRGDHAGGDDLLLRAGTPMLAQPLGVRRRRPARVVGDEDDRLAVLEQAGAASRPRRASDRCRPRRPRRGRSAARRIRPPAPSRAGYRRRSAPRAESSRTVKS